jgi:RNA 3'-terminal phosphate cyclase (ATP)
MEMLKIDGAYGEGGGQIIRTAVSLSCITQKPIQIENIRKNRKNPGLRAQHLTAIKLLSKICNAKVDGLHVGSTSLKFIPSEIQSLELQEDIGTAGSISLVLQVLIVPVAIADKKLKLTIIGGTDVPWSPTIDYTSHVLSAAYSRMEINFFIDVKKRGYYPRGGGKVSLEVYPSKKISPISLSSPTRKNIIANLFCSYSKYHSNEIMIEIEKIKEMCEKNQIKINSFVKDVGNKKESPDKGGSILMYSHDPSSIIGVDHILDPKKKFSGEGLVDKFLANSPFGVDVNLSDMLVVPASLINDTSVYRVREISKHLETNLYVASKITGCKYGIGRLDDGGYEIRICGNSDSSI